MSETASEGVGYDDEDTRSVITSATITPSESASEIFNNPFNVLQPPSSSGSSTPRSHSVNTLPHFNDNDSILTSQLSTTSTAKATLNSSFYLPPTSAPSVVTTESLVSPRSGARKDWAAQSDDEDEEEEEAPTPASHSPQTTFEKSLKTLSLTDEDYYDDNDDDGAGIWITPSNIKKHKIRDFTTTNSHPTSTTPTASNKLHPDIAPSPPQYREQRRRSSASDRAGNPVGAVMKSACMTGDFAIQNVALQMGLNLVSVEGSERIKNVKTWVLRCHGCFTYPHLPPSLHIVGGLMEGLRRRWI